MAVRRLYLADHGLTDVLASTALAFNVIALVALRDTCLEQRFSTRRMIAHQDLVRPDIDLP